MYKAVLISIVLVLFTLVNCKKSSNNLEPNAVSILAGKWQLIAEEGNQNGNLTWINIPSSDSVYIYFRDDGIQVDKNGCVPCCPANTVILNGKKFDLVSKYPLLSCGPCRTDLCSSCDQVNIEIDENQLVYESCGNSIRHKFKMIL